MMIDEIISLCCEQDAKTWAFANKSIIKYIPSKKYSVIVPDDEVVLFKSISDARFNIEPESKYSQYFESLIKSHLPEGKLTQTHWYLQQFVKLELLNQLNNNELAVLWDGDTIPLQPINFIDHSGKLLYFIGNENHPPYFKTINKLLGIQKQLPYSFIAQSFPIKSQWFKEFKTAIEQRSGKSWIEAIIDSIDFSQSNAFSEYESLGSFIAKNHPDEISFLQDPWLRLGNSLIGDVSLLNSSTAVQKLAPYKYVSFEKWDRAKPVFFKVTIPIFNDQVVKPIFTKLLNIRNIRTIYTQFLQSMGTLKIDAGVGIFSCCTVRLESILAYFNQHHTTPKIVDSSTQFSYYKENINENISKDLFAQREDVTIQWDGQPIKITQSSDEQQFSNYHNICFATITPFIKKYFSPSNLITNTVEQLEASSKIDYENTCVIRYRGTDKEAETVQPPFSEILDKALAIKEKHPLIQFAVQTDDKEFRKFIYRALGDCCFEVENSTWEGWSGKKDFIDFYASIFLLSKCKYLITTSGNGELWLMLFRGHANGVYQYLQHKEFVYGLPNKSYTPGKTSFWISASDKENN